MHSLWSCGHLISLRVLYAGEIYHSKPQDGGELSFSFAKSEEAIINERWERRDGRKTSFTQEIFKEMDVLNYVCPIASWSFG